MFDRRPLLLDGGMGKALHAQGAPFRQPEWSALALMEDPSSVRRAHDSFIAAGADVVITSNYAVVPFHIGDDRFEADGAALTELAGRLAREAAEASDRNVMVAGSIPPLFGSYEPDEFDPDRAPTMLAVITTALAEHVDLFVAETQSCLAEAEASLTAAAAFDVPRWVSFTPAEDAVDGRARLRSGESVEDAVAVAERHGCQAVLFNCSQPEIMEFALRDAVQARTGALEIGAYANSFEPKGENYRANSVVLGYRSDLDTVGYGDFVDRWLELGATIVGGCCGIMPDHIAALRQSIS